MENLYTQDCIRTFTGKYINVFEPDPELIDIEDIAHALSHQCRFGGHLRHFYSVAQHSIVCCRQAQEGHQLAALLHDASEAYLLDIPSPIKKRLPDYQAIEARLQEAIEAKFGFTVENHVKMIDALVLVHEYEALVLRNPDYEHKLLTRDIRGLILTPEEAKEDFLIHFNEYYR